MALTTNQQIVAGLVGAGVLAAAAFTAGRYQGGESSVAQDNPAVTAPAGDVVARVNGAQDQAQAARQAGQDAISGTSPSRQVAAADPAPRPSTSNRPVSRDSSTGGGGGYDNAPAPSAGQQAAAPRLCSGCAVVQSVRTVSREGQGTGIGVVGGAVIGGLLGSQIGGGTGKKVATVGGAVAGGYAGNEIEKRQRASTVWVVKLRHADQTIRSLEYGHDPQVQSGDVVRVRDGRLERQ